MREPLRECSVVGEQDQAAAVGVEAPYGIEAATLFGDQLHHRGTAVGVARRGEHADGLVHGVDDPWLGSPEWLPVDLDAVALVHIAGRVAHQLPVDAHAPGDDQRLGGPPRGDASVGEVLGETHGLQR